MLSASSGESFSSLRAEEQSAADAAVIMPISLLSRLYAVARVLHTEVTAVTISAHSGGKIASPWCTQLGSMARGCLCEIDCDCRKTWHIELNRSLRHVFCLGDIWSVYCWLARAWDSCKTLFMTSIGLDGQPVFGFLWAEGLLGTVGHTLFVSVPAHQEEQQLTQPTKRAARIQMISRKGWPYM